MLSIFLSFRVGHTLKFGGSTRLLILQGPEEDMDDESPLSVKELQEKVRLKAVEEEKKIKEIKELEEKKVGMIIRRI